MKVLHEVKRQPTENGRWRAEMTADEMRLLKRYDRQIATQIATVAAHPKNRELLAALALLKYERYLLQSKAAARLKRRKQGCRSRWPQAAARNTTNSRAVHR
jgi:hypothetical protein